MEQLNKTGTFLANASVICLEEHLAYSEAQWQLSHAFGLHCLLWRWKPAACGKRVGFMQVTGQIFLSVKRKLMLGHHWIVQRDNDAKHTWKIPQGLDADEVQEDPIVALTVI